MGIVRHIAAAGNGQNAVCQFPGQIFAAGAPCDSRRCNLFIRRFRFLRNGLHGLRYRNGFGNRLRNRGGRLRSSRLLRPGGLAFRGLRKQLLLTLFRNYLPGQLCHRNNRRCGFRHRLLRIRLLGKDLRRNQGKHHDRRQQQAHTPSEHTHFPFQVYSIILIIPPISANVHNGQPFL